jgi:hypothetical protein
MKKFSLNRVLQAAAALVCVSAMCSSANGAMLNLTQMFPDLTLGNLTVGYVLAGGTFTADGGSPTKLEPDGLGGLPEIGTSAFEGASASIVLHLNPADGSLIDGTLTILGTIPTEGMISGTLLTGVAKAFGFDESFPDPVGVFEIEFDVTGGDLQTQYFPTSVGIILTGNGGASYPGVFTESFSFSARTGAGDLFPTPEPSGFAILAVGAAGLSLRYRGRRKRLG